MSIKGTFEQKGVWVAVYLISFFFVTKEVVYSVTGANGLVERGSLSIIGLVVGSMLGFGTHWMVRSGSHTLKAIVLVGAIAALGLSAKPLTAYVESLRYYTCDVCGFIAVDRNTHECGACGTKLLFDTSYTDGDKEDFIREEQLFWFMTDDSTQKVDFYESLEKVGSRKFIKDKQWKPIVTEREVFEYSRATWTE